MDTIIGLDIGGTKTAIVEGRASGEIIQRIQFPTEATVPFAERATVFSESISGLVEQASKEGRRIVAISVSIGGPLRILEGYILDPPHLPGWHNLALKTWLESQFPGVPVFVEHDGNAGALAEYHFGAGAQFDNIQHMIFLTFGTGLGAGIILNGQIFRGATDTAGEVGHWRLADDGPFGFGKAGSWEGFASGAGFISLATRMYPERWSDDTPIAEFIGTVLDGDNDANRVIDVSAEYMGRGIAMLVDALNPHMVVLGTLARVLGERYLQPVRDVVQREALPPAVNACQIVAAELGDRLGDVASLMAALTQKKEGIPSTIWKRKRR